jgi:predicted DNA-binding transcriptional regulator YafY
MAARPVTPKHFESVVSALINRQRLSITHFHRGREETLSREVSPQRVVHYRDNWYLDAWCHQRNALRTFAMDSIQHVTALDDTAQDIPDHRLDAELGAGYGIFAGPATEVAKLRFSPKRARWVANEQWHPEQRGETRVVGSFILEVPYSDDRELVMDIMKYGPDVEVLEPASLREHVIDLHQEAARRYTLAGPRKSAPRSQRARTDNRPGRRLGS